jgi:hypothetical protein
MSNELHKQREAGPPAGQGVSDTDDRGRGNKSRDELEKVSAVKIAMLIGFAAFAYLAILAGVTVIAVLALITERVIK